MKPPVFNHQHYTDLEADYMILKVENEKLKAQLSTTNKRVEAQRWIPVTERLPEKNDDYLVYYAKTYTGGFEATWNGICSFIDSHGGWQTDTCETVTHWMPLPAPPEKEGE